MEEMVVVGQSGFHSLMVVEQFDWWYCRSYLLVVVSAVLEQSDSHILMAV
jgi:hypothetical protein